MQHNKVYLTLAQSRAWGAEWPIGDPHAFGKREMPVIAVVGAIGSAVAGAGMIAAGTAVLGSVALGTVLGGAMLVGGVMSVIGTVTGNEKLAKIGGILSMVGGIGAFAGGAIGAAQQGAGFMDSVKAGMSTVTGAFNDGAKALGLDFLADASTTAPISEANPSAVAEAAAGAGDGIGAVSGVADMPPADYSLGTGSLSSTPAPSLQMTANAPGAAAPAAGTTKPGLLASLGLDKKDMLYMASGLGDALTGNSEAEALEKKTAFEREQWKTQQANAKAQVFMFDPNNPAQVAQAQQYAAQGIPVQPIGVTPGMTVQPIRTTPPAPIYSLPPAPPAAPTV